ncbi:DUF294 nucleotidyltransferase-like domain-containing protein [Salinibius halmophilus]|uniref:DUF294 nucleotidyltransferase-like domain-containing protein n=1 Tax=Salinibius halmophilus TaxID=1853216 RepID=UPI000E676330|nr:DUF294 nucleotidyltransferase-like domain-containing protein [Salinibius halmophilus]
MTNNPYLDFLTRFPPFDELPNNILEQLSGRLAVSYLRQGEAWPSKPGLAMIRAGAFELYNQDGELIDRLSEGELLGVQSLLQRQSANVHATCIEDALLISLSLNDCDWLIAQAPIVDTFLRLLGERRVAWGQRSAQQQSLPSHDKVMHCMSTDLLTAPTSITIQNAAELMTEKQVGSLLVVENQELLGIVTDRDLRKRVVATGLPLNTSVASILTSRPITISPNATVFDAMLIMAEHSIHHLPVVDRQLCGLITSTDVLRYRELDPVNVIKRIKRCHDVEQIKEVVASFKQVLQALLAQGEEGLSLSRFYSKFWDVVSRRLLSIHQQRLAYDSPFAWLVFGSQAREEMHLGSDQDNGIIYPDHLSDTVNLQALAEAVNKDLDTLGLAWCQGGVMASQKAFFRSVSEWRAHYQKLIDQANSDAVLALEILLDIRVIDGDHSLATAIDDIAKQAAGKAQLLLAELTRDLLRTHTSSGWLANLLNQSKPINVKTQLLTPINDTARLLAFAHGIRSASSSSRLVALLDLEPDLPIQGLIDGHEFLLQWRWRQQLQGTDNLMVPKQLKPVERYQLKELLKAIDELQKLLGYRYLRRV